jgi:tetratricopeptide (TPR) repeat protein
MIGLGIHADREYRRARGITAADNLETNYVRGVKQGFDTTMDVTEEQQSAIQWDFNSTVEHGKSIALINALESVIGAETFQKLYRRCLNEYAGRQLGWREFQRVAESESGQDLGWFFEQWVRSSGSAAYRVADKKCAAAGEAFNCRVHIERTGEMRMPVTVSARFEDGSEQRARTERLADMDELEFRAKAPLKEVVIEPDSAVAMAEAPLTPANWMARIREMPWTGVGVAALEAYRQAGELQIADAYTQWKLALLLYDGRHYPEALDAMTREQHLAKGDLQFGALVWQGHILDLLGRRSEAVARYEEALKMEGSPSIRHDQYNMTINKQRVEDRVKTPFERK